MSNDKTKNKNIGKFFFPKYGYGENHLKGWWAEQTSPNTVRIHRHNNTYIDMSEGDSVASVSGSVQIKGDRVCVGDYVVPLFSISNNKTNNQSSLSFSSLRARSIKSMSEGKKSFIIESEDGSIRQKVNEGDFFAPIGKYINLTDNGQLIAEPLETNSNENSDRELIAVHPLEYEINIMVFQERLNGGYKAYMNRKEPGSNHNMKDGIAGVFYPKTNTDPANFSEMSPEDRTMYPTCKLYSTKNKYYASAQMIDRETAERKRFLYKKIKQMESESESAGFSLGDHPLFDQGEYEEHIDFKENNAGTVNRLFVIQKGAELITGEKPRYNNSSPSPR